VSIGPGCPWVTFPCQLLCIGVALGWPHYVAGSLCSWLSRWRPQCTLFDYTTEGTAAILTHGCGVLFCTDINMPDPWTHACSCCHCPGINGVELPLHACREAPAMGCRGVSPKCGRSAVPQGTEGRGGTTRSGRKHYNPRTYLARVCPCNCYLITMGGTSAASCW
jgi:hypothetical protein